jgi:hypothetical protein
MTLDLRPRLLLYPPGAGVVVVLIDPTSLTTGTVTLPVLGALPYSIAPGFPASVVTLHTPAGEVFFSVDPFTDTGGGHAGTVPIPGLGDVPYAVVLGPPDIPAEALFGAGLSGWLVPAALLLVAVLFMRRG